jgi:hypothetical protein
MSGVFKVIQGLVGLRSDTTNADSNTATRVVVTNPSPADAPGPTDLTLSSNDVTEDTSINGLVATLTTINGTAPFTYAITDDPDNKFTISFNELRLDSTVDFDTDQDHNVTIEVTDDNGKTFEKTFVINVLEVALGAGDKEITLNGIDEAVSVSTINEIDQGNLSFTFCFEVTRSRVNVDETIFSQQLTNLSKRGCEVYFDSNDRLRFALINSLVGNEYAEIRIGGAQSQGLNEKAFYCLTYDGSKDASGMEIYKNGSLATITTVFDTLTSSSVITSSAGVLFGLRSDGTRYLQGRLDNIMLFNKVLSASEISTLYNGGTPLESLQSEPTLLSANVMHVAIDSLDVYPTLTDKRGNYDLTMNANMAQGNIVDAGAIT